MEFLVILEEGKLRGRKQNREKLFTRESSQQARRRIGKYFWVSFNTTNYDMRKNPKINKKYFWIFEVFQTHKKKAKIKLTWIHNENG